MINSNNVPLEVVFMSNSTESFRDPIKKNRIHFKLPDIWCNAIKHDPMIGIRNIFIVKGFKHPRLKLSYSLLCDETQTVTYQGSDVQTTEETVEVKSENIILEKYFDDDDLIKAFVGKINNRLDKLAFNSVFTTNNGFTQAQLDTIKQEPFLHAHFEYVEDNDVVHHNELVFDSPFNDLDESIRTMTVETDNTTTEKLYYFKFDVTLENQAAQRMFTSKVGTFDSDPVKFVNVWDRNACILYSNISEQCDNNYLGHTRKQPIPQIKYYKLKGSYRSFWVDLYATCDHKAPVILTPEDELFIEAQLI